jgi:hypothetical protein
MDTLLTIVALAVLAGWAVLWVLATAALVANEPKPAPQPWTGASPGPFRPQPRASRP